MGLMLFWRGLADACSQGFGSRSSLDLATVAVVDEWTTEGGGVVSEGDTVMVGSADRWDCEGGRRSPYITVAMVSHVRVAVDGDSGDLSNLLRCGNGLGVRRRELHDFL